MQTHLIPLESLAVKGKIKTKIENGEFHIPAEETNLGKNRHHFTIPGTYKPPFRICVTAKLEFKRTNQIASQLTWYIGRGNMYFNGGHTIGLDIFSGDKIVPDFLLHNYMPSQEFVEISVMFGHEMLWVSVDDKYCYATENAPYMLASLQNGLDIAMCGGTDTKLTIRSITITEYDNDEPDIPKELANLPQLSPFELYAKGLPLTVHEEMLALDEYLLADKKLKFKRSIDKHGHLIYKSPCGLQYQIREYGVGKRHELHWVQSKTKPDRTNEVFKKMAEFSPEFAEKIFAKLKICSPHKRDCDLRTTIEFNGEARQVCRSKIPFKMHPQEFEDLKMVVKAAAKIIF